MGKVLYIAHRGDSFREPENTLRAVKAAINLKADMVEVDVRQTKDGQIVVIHDETVDRTTDGSGYVKNLTFDAIRRLDAGLGEKIPTLKEVMDVVKGKVKLVIELKDCGIESKIVNTINKAGMIENVIVSSFIHQTLKKIKRFNPKIQTGVIFKCAPINSSQLALNCNSSILFPNYRYVTVEMIEDAHRNGFPLYVWAVNALEQAKRYIEMDVDGIVTNNLDIREHVVQRVKRVFIAGPIQGMERKQDYRKILRKILESHNFQVIDPWEREKVVYEYRREDWWNTVPIKGFIKRDLEDIARSDFFVAYLPKISAGTCMELFHAYEKGKPIFIISKLNLSPWIVAHATGIFANFDEFDMYLRKTCF